MRLKSLVFCIAFTFSLLNSGDISAQIDTVLIPAAIHDTIQDTLGIGKSTKVKSDMQKVENPFYRVEIKEERTYDNVFSRIFLSNAQNVKSELIGLSRFFPKPLSGLFQNIVEKSFRFPIVFVFLALILALAGNVLLVIAILFITNMVMNFRAKRYRVVRDFFEKTLTDLMLQVTDKKETMRLLTKYDRKRHVNMLIDVMMDFQKSFRGDSDRQIMEIYERMNLSKISYNKTYSMSFYEQVKGLRELTNMNHHQATEMIMAKLNDQIDIVRTEAQICYPYANPESPFEFLSFLERPFSRWAQLNIYYLIKIHEMPVPSFDKWINSPNPNVVNFCILMIDLFQQQENSQHIINLLTDSNETTRNMAISTCGDLHLFDSKYVMKNNFQSETHRNQIEIIKAFNLIGDETDISFIATTIESESIALRLEAIRTLYNMGEGGRERLTSLNLFMNLALSPYISHIQDIRN
ncbi:MAG: hypothetical protein M0R39_15470 [Prolixibacteraceae bacterium]|nr:hypothetical protein [Prolixibacteraceae bacterium]